MNTIYLAEVYIYYYTTTTTDEAILSRLPTTLPFITITDTSRISS